MDWRQQGHAAIETSRAEPIRDRIKSEYPCLQDTLPGKKLIIKKYDYIIIKIIELYITVVFILSEYSTS